MTNVEALATAMACLNVNSEGESGYGADRDRMAYRRLEKILRREQRAARTRSKK